MESLQESASTQSPRCDVAWTASEVNRYGTGMTFLEEEGCCLCSVFNLADGATQASFRILILDSCDPPNFSIFFHTVAAHSWTNSSLGWSQLLRPRFEKGRECDMAQRIDV